MQGSITVFLAFHSDAETAEDVFDENYSEEQLSCSRQVVEYFLLEIRFLAPINRQMWIGPLIA